MGKLKMLPKLAEMGAFFPKIVSKRALQGSDPHATDFSLDDFPDPALLAATMAAGSSRCRMVFSSNPDTGKRNCGCIACRFSTSAPRACTGRRTSRARSTTGAWRQRARTKRMDVAVAIGADPATMYSAILPLPPDLDEMMIAGFPAREPGRDGEVRNRRHGGSGECGDRAGRLCRAGRTAPRRARSAITRDSIRWKTIIRCSMLLVSRIARIRCTRRPLWALRRWRISTWARRSSGFSCR